jgi:ATP-dependent helicase/nuclease subunit B
MAPVTLLAMLKHPLLRLGAAPGHHARTIATLEMALLRGPRPKAGSAGLAHALQTFRDEQADLHKRDPRAGLAEADLDLAAELVDRLSFALAPLEGLPNAPHRLAEFASRHRDVVAKLGCDHEDETPAFAGPDGRALSAALDELAASAPAGQLAVAPGDYPELFQAAIFDRVVRRPGAAGVRVRILGPLEARLAPHDRIVLGGLNEGTWPPETATDAWLSRPMRQDLGLDLPERRIGLSAHDFAQGMGAPEVFLTRAAKVAGAPTVASRFMQRLAAVAGKARWDIVGQRGADYVAWSRTLDRPAKDERIKPPAPKPPLAARPRQLSVTEIENWLRDPYTIYARHILKLAPLDPVDLPPGGRDRGIVIHGALGEFTQTFAKALPPDPAAELIRLGVKHFAPLDDYPEARALWWPRFRRIADWFAGFEARRRTDLRMLDAEMGGRIPINSAGGVFTLTARADRIELRADGRYAIVDYKTGVVPTEKQVRTGLSPQMTLESAILRQGGFKTIPAGASICELLYVALKGGEPAGVEESIVFKDGTPDEQADIALAKLATLVGRFDNPEQPYRSLVLSMWRTRYGSYDHLARVKEWSLSGGEPGGEE